MASCDRCGEFILFGGVREGDRRYCGPECAAGGFLAARIAALPASEIEERVRRVHRGQCPRCSGAGPVDVHTSHWVYSVVAMTRYGRRSQVCCRGCGRKAQFKDGLFSLLFGWWGIPHGLALTPVQLLRDFGAFVGISGPRADTPSALLRNQIARTMVGEKLDADLTFPG